MTKHFIHTIYELKPGTQFESLKRQFEIMTRSTKMLLYQINIMEKWMERLYFASHVQYVNNFENIKRIVSPCICACMDVFNTFSVTKKLIPFSCIYRLCMVITGIQLQ